MSGWEAYNQTRRVLITHDGRTQTMDQWSAETGVPRATIRSRLNRGLPAEQVLLKTDGRRRVAR